MDPRLVGVRKQLEHVRRIIAVTGGKGGIGKSIVASTMALVLAKEGYRTGLLDLDFTGPCDHVVLGIGDQFPEEEFGIRPPVINGVHFMSVTYFVGNRPTPLRGIDITNALLELLAITRWEEVDILVIDMPPGLGDTTLDVVRFLTRAEYLIVSTASRVVIETVRRSIRLHTELDTGIVGIVENMSRGGSEAVSGLASEFGLPFLGTLPFDPGLEEAIGDTERLSRTRFSAGIRELVGALVNNPG